MPEYTLPAPMQGAGVAGRSNSQPVTYAYLACARDEISNFPLALDCAADAAIAFAEIVHEMECEGAGQDWATALGLRLDDPLVLLPHLPPQATDAVRREVERKLRQ